MKLHIINCFLITISCLWPLNGFACDGTDDWPDLNAWVCAANKSMNVRDKNKSYTRKAELITNQIDIIAIRAFVQQDDNETCRRYRDADFDRPFTRILAHQSLPASSFAEATEFAAAEVWNASEDNPLVTCEVQQLVEGELFHRYINLYYFKFGPVRKGRHFIIRVTTRWSNGTFLLSSHN